MTPKDTKSLIETQDGAGARAAVGTRPRWAPGLFPRENFSMFSDICYAKRRDHRRASPGLCRLPAQKKGIGVSVHDAQERPVVSSGPPGQRILAEHGPNSIMLTSPDHGVGQDLGLEDRVCAPGEIAKNRFIVRGKAAPASARPRPSSPRHFFSTRAKPACCSAVHPALPADADESLGDFVRRRIGRNSSNTPSTRLSRASTPATPNGSRCATHSRSSTRWSSTARSIRGQVFGRRSGKRPEKGKNEAGMISSITDSSSSQTRSPGGSART